MRNLGNTCFAAAAVCALSACGRVRAEVGARGGALAAGLAAVMADHGSPAWPGLVRAMDPLVGRGAGEPHDSHELICALVDRLGLESCFRVATVTGLRCEACGALETRGDTNVYVASEPAESLAAGLAGAHAPRWVEDRECGGGCGRRGRAWARTVPRAPGPPVLVVRVSPRARGLAVERLIYYCGGVYRLRAAVVYRGDGRSGHYECAVPGRGGGWRLHDDGAERDLPAGAGGGSFLRGLHTALYERDGHMGRGTPE